MNHTEHIFSLPKTQHNSYSSRDHYHQTINAHVANPITSGRNNTSITSSAASTSNISNFTSEVFLISFCHFFNYIEKLLLTSLPYHSVLFFIITISS